MIELVIKGVFTMETSDGFSIHPKVIDLLKEIELTGSLNSAVEHIGMSYSYAWNLMNKTNCKLNTPLIITKRGGNGGGIAKLTDAGKKLLDHYNKLEQDFGNLMGTHTIKLKS